MDSDAALRATAAVAAARVQPGYRFRRPASGHAIGRAAHRRSVRERRLRLLPSSKPCRTPYNSAMSLSRPVFTALLLCGALTAARAESPAAPAVPAIHAASATISSPATLVPGAQRTPRVALLPSPGLPTVDHLVVRKSQ